MQYAQLLGMPGQFYPGPNMPAQFFPPPNYIQPSQEEPESVPETQDEPEGSGRGRGRRSHKKKDPNAPRQKKQQERWERDEEYNLARAWLDISEDPEVG